MRSINHSLTGALIGLSVSEPAISLPVSFLSHYLLDVIPHFGFKDGDKAMSLSKFNILLVIDAVLCLGLVVWLIIAKPRNWLIAIICAFLAASPDFFSLNKYIKYLKNEKWKPNIYSRFAKNIQWFEKPIGAVSETIWFIGSIVILAIYF